MTVGEIFSLDNRTEFPRYTATLRSIAGNIAKITIIDANDSLDVNILADLSDRVIRFTEGQIHLRKTFGGVKLELEEAN